MKRSHSFTLACSVAMIAGAGSVFGQEFTVLGTNADVSEMSADGSILVGGLFSGESFYWTEDTGMVVIGGANGSPHISRDGSTIVGREFSSIDGIEEAAIWMNDLNWQTIGNVPGGDSCDNFRSSAWGTNVDGSVIVGLAWVENCRAHAFIYDDVNGMVDLGSTVADRSSRANGISDDGHVVIGWQDASDGFRQGAMWIDGVQTTFSMDDIPVGEAQGTNSDGSIIVGSSALQQGWIWTENDGVQQTGVLPGFNYNGYNIDCSEDGSVIVGFSGFGFDRLAHVWTADTGCIRADEYLASHGVEIPEGYSLATATAVSADGNTIAGWGFDAQFTTVAWRATISDEPVFGLSVDQLVGGETAQITVSGAEPEQAIFLCYSTTGLGETVVSQLNVTLDLDTALLAKRGRADADGNATWQRTVPAAWSGREIWMQGAVYGQTTEVVSQVIQ